MEKQDIQLYDITRILFGEVPAVFYLEAVFRMVVIYLVLMLSMRFMGKRLASQIGRNEMAAMVSLAAAIGVPLQDPTRGILPIVIIAFVVMFFHNLTGRKAAANQRFERISQGDVALLIADGVLDLENLKKSRLARGRLFAQLRFTKITHLGMVEKPFLEANGTFSLKRSTDSSSGLPVIPAWDTDFLSDMEIDPAAVACANCGKIESKDQQPSTCPSCQADEWTIAVR